MSALPPPHEAHRAHEIERLELRIATFLRYGALAAGAILFIGWMMRLSRAGDPFAAFAEHHDLPLIASVRAAWQAGDAGLLVGYAGLAALISLPILRVAFTALLFVRGGERRLAAAAVFVLAVLALSFFLGFEV